MENFRILIVKGGIYLDPVEKTWLLSQDIDAILLPWALMDEVRTLLVLSKISSTPKEVPADRY
jgi:hypothetical protein